MTWQRLSPWVFPSLGRGPDDVIVTIADDPPPREDFERLHPSLGCYLVNEWISAPEPRDQLAALWLELTGERLVASEAGARKLVTLIEDERLYLWGPIRAGVTEPAVFPDQPSRKDPVHDLPRPTEDLGTVWLRLYVSPARASSLPDAFELAAEDGSYRRRKRLATDLIRETECVDLCFDRVPMDKTYLLQVFEPEDRIYYAFRHTPCAALGSLPPEPPPPLPDFYEHEPWEVEQEPEPPVMVSETEEDDR